MAGPTAPAMPIGPAVDHDRQVAGDRPGEVEHYGLKNAAQLATGRTRADEYANALVPLPEHLAVNGLMWNFLWQLYSAIQDWAAWAIAEVTS